MFFDTATFHATFAKLLAMLIADTVIRQITCYADTVKLQKDIDLLYDW